MKRYGLRKAIGFTAVALVAVIKIIAMLVAIMVPAVGRARETFDSGIWRKAPAAHRANVLFKAARIIEERIDELAELEAQCCHVPLTFALCRHAFEPLFGGAA